MKRASIAALVIAALLIVTGAQIASAQRADTDRIILAKVYFRVNGLGSFTANSYNTASGAQIGIFEAGSGISLKAVPAPGWKFSHWTLNGNYAGCSPSSCATARIGLEIRAHFVEN